MLDSQKSTDPLEVSSFAVFLSFSQLIQFLWREECIKIYLKYKNPEVKITQNPSFTTSGLNLGENMTYKSLGGMDPGVVKKLLQIMTTWLKCLQGYPLSVRGVIGAINMQW